MRKHISFSIAATIVGLAMVFWAIFGVVYTKAEIVRPKVELSSSISHPHLQAQVLARSSTDRRGRKAGAGPQHDPAPRSFRSSASTPAPCSIHRS